MAAASWPVWRCRRRWRCRRSRRCRRAPVALRRYRRQRWRGLRWLGCFRHRWQFSGASDWSASSTSNDSSTDSSISIDSTPSKLRQPQALLAPDFVELPRQGRTPGKQPSSRFRKPARWRVELAAARDPESSRRVGAIPSVPRRPSLRRDSAARPVRSLRRASGRMRSRRPWRQTATPRRRRPVPEVSATRARRAKRAGCTSGSHRPVRTKVAAR